jgi:hypothetical protein
MAEPLPAAKPQAAPLAPRRRLRWLLPAAVALAVLGGLVAMDRLDLLAVTTGTAATEAVQPVAPRQAPPAARAESVTEPVTESAAQTPSAPVPGAVTEVQPDSEPDPAAEEEQTPVVERRPRRHRPKTRRRAPLDRVPDVAPDVDPLVQHLVERPDDATTILASRIYSRNKSSLMACDTLAERRGEQLEGLRATFNIQVRPSGAVHVHVEGQGLGPRLRACYRAVASQWALPVRGLVYTTSFQHVL